MEALFHRWCDTDARRGTLLILDGNCSHTLDLAVIEIPRKHGIFTLSLPSHSMHVQPLDVTCFKDIEYVYGISDRNGS
jgi:hypothetical protein